MKGIICLLCILVEVRSHIFTKKEDYILNEVFKHRKPVVDSFLDFEPIKTFVDYYHDGVQAYLANDWESCINHLERSIVMYHNYYDAITECRIKCEIERNRFIPKYKENYEHRHFFEKMVYKTLCMEKCRRWDIPDTPRFFMISHEDKQIFKMRKPYEYLQICYYKDHEIDKAISATYTALVANPGDELMKKNILYYAKLQQFDLDKLKDFEDKKFSPYYRDGVDKYDQKEWNQAIEKLEIAINIWLEEHEKCRAFCEGEFHQGWMPDFVTSVSNHYVFGIRCKQNCTAELSFINGRYYDDLYPSMYNYLQYAYYQIGKKKAAVQCAQSFLLFYPSSEEMLSNIAYYKVQADITRDFFQPRDEARKFYYRDFYEKELLQFIDDEFSKITREDNFRQQSSVQGDILENKDAAKVVAKTSKDLA